jgi:MFS family permease
MNPKPSGQPRFLTFMRWFRMLRGAPRRLWVAFPAALLAFVRRFTVLKGAPRELWVVLGAKLLVFVAYGIMNTTFPLWLSSDLGYNDIDAGFVVTTWSALMTFFTVFVGSLTDALGVRKALLLGLGICAASRAVLTFTSIKWLALFGGMAPLALGEAMTVPVLVAAIRRFSTTAQRSMAFSMFYAAMNAGFLVAYYVFDFVRQHLGEASGHLTLPLIGVSLTSYRVLFLAALLFQVLILVIVYVCLRNGVEATDEGVKVIPERPKYPNTNPARALQLATRDAGRDTVRIFLGLWRQPGFHKFLIFLGLAAFLRIIFIHTYYTYPKFGIRELGEGAPVGKLSGINSILIVFLVPLVGALSQRIAAYRMVTIGSVIAAGSVFIMAMPPQWFQGLANGPFGHFIAHTWLHVPGEVNPYYVMICLFMIMLSIGEAIYSPRLYEYAAVIAPKGQEGSYMSLSYLPFFLAKLLATTCSGMLLARYCPATGPRHSETLWLIIALPTLIAPLGLICLQRFIRVPEAGRS